MYTLSQKQESSPALAVVSVASVSVMVFSATILCHRIRKNEKARAREHESKSLF